MASRQERNLLLTLGFSVARHSTGLWDAVVGGSVLAEYQESGGTRWSLVVLHEPVHAFFLAAI